MRSLLTKLSRVGGGVHHVPSTDLVSGKFDQKQDKLTAGNNISISETGVIESIGWTGTADIKTEFSDLDPSTDLEVPSAKLVESEFKKIWNGYGIYKNPTTGRLEIYKPLMQSADGSIKIVKDYGMVLKVAPVEESDNTLVFCGDDGRGHFSISTDVSYWHKTNVYIYDENYSQIAKFDYQTIGYGNYHMPLGFGGFFLVLNDYIYIYTKHENSSHVKIYSISSGKFGVNDHIKEIILPLSFEDMSTNVYRAGIQYNDASDHILIFEHSVANSKHMIKTLVYDKELNPVIDENTGQQIINTYSSTEYVPRGYPSLKTVKIYNSIFMFPVFNTTNYMMNNHSVLLKITDDDNIEQVHEAIMSVEEGTEDTLLCEKDEDGNRIYDTSGTTTPSINNVYRPITTEGNVIKLSSIDTTHNLPTNGYTFSYPSFNYSTHSDNMKSNIYTMSDGITVYAVLSDGRLIDTWQYYNLWGPVGNASYTPRYRAKRSNWVDYPKQIHVNFPIGCATRTYGFRPNNVNLACLPNQSDTKMSNTLAVYSENNCYNIDVHDPINFNIESGDYASSISTNWNKLNNRYGMFQKCYFCDADQISRKTY